MMITALILTSVEKDIRGLEIVHDSHSPGPIKDWSREAQEDWENLAYVAKMLPRSGYFISGFHFNWQTILFCIKSSFKYLWKTKFKFVLGEIWIRDLSYSELVIVVFTSHCLYFWNHQHCQCLHLSQSTAKRGFQSLRAAVVTFSSAGWHSIRKSRFWLAESSAVQVWHKCKSATPYRNFGLWLAERQKEIF